MAQMVGIPEPGLGGTVQLLIVSGLNFLLPPSSAQVNTCDLPLGMTGRYEGGWSTAAADSLVASVLTIANSNTAASTRLHASPSPMSRTRRVVHVL